MLRHADLNGIPRIAASRAVLRARTVGTPSSTLVIPAGKTLTDAQGLVYLATAGNVVTDGSGFGFFVVTARDAGGEQNLPVNATLTWQNGAPAGMAGTYPLVECLGSISNGKRCVRITEDTGATLKFYYLQDGVTWRTN